MKNNLSRTLLILTALMLINSYDSNCYASPFSDDGDLSIKNKISEGYKNLKKKANDVKEDIVDAVSDGYETVKDKASDIKEDFVEGVGIIKDTISDKADKAKKKVTSGAGSVKNFFVDGYQSTTKKINSAFNNDSYPGYINNAIFLPGHESKEMVCQGIAFLTVDVKNDSNQVTGTFDRYILLSYYPKSSNQPSQLVVIDRANGNGKPIRRFPLYKSESKAYTGHAGGIAVAGNYVWVASGNKIFGFSKDEILDFINETNVQAEAVNGLPDSFDELPAKNLICKQSYGVDSKASYVSFDGTYIWVGDFTKASSSDYKPVKHHKAFGRNCWIAGYMVDSTGMPTSDTEYTYTAGDSSYTVHKPDAVIAMRESVQGMAVCGNHVALTISYGAQNSKLALYNNPLTTGATQFSYKPAGQDETFTVDAWELENKKNWVNTVTLAAGAEDLEYDGKNLYVTFECSSKNYRQKWININPTIKLTDDFYLIDVDKAVAYDD